MKKSVSELVKEHQENSGFHNYKFSEELESDHVGTAFKSRADFMEELSNIKEELNEAPVIKSIKPVDRKYFEAVNALETAKRKVLLAREKEKENLDYKRKFAKDMDGYEDLVQEALFEYDQKKQKYNEIWEEYYGE